MKKYFLLVLMATAIFASCSKDDSVSPTVTAKDLVGTWEFQNPQASEVVVKGSDSELESTLKEYYESQIKESLLIQPIVITFNSDMTCTGVGKDEKEVIKNYKGTYTVINNRLTVKLLATDNSGAKPNLNGALEVKDGNIYFICDKESCTFTYSEMLKESGITPDEIKLFQGFIDSINAGITEVRCPLQMVKK